ncbi:MAG: tyrosine-type recombinase/integrase [bacterium]
MLRDFREVYKNKHTRNIAIIEVLVNTGIRVGELVSLTLEDVSISPRKGHLTVREGKGESFREVPLNKDVRKAISAYLKERSVSKSNKIFLGQRGPLKETAIWRIVKKYAERAGVNASPHKLRHTFATRLLRDHDTDIVTVSKLLGHANVNSTAIYTQLSQKDMERAVDRLSND